MTHRCHANGCAAEDAHPEAPFCPRHFKALHPNHQKKLWSGRRQDGVCGACQPGVPRDLSMRAASDWQELFNLAVAILLVLDYERCGAGPELHDDHTGFCWGCGVDNAQKTYAQANRAVVGLR